MADGMVHIVGGHVERRDVRQLADGDVAVLDELREAVVLLWRPFFKVPVPARHVRWESRSQRRTILFGTISEVGDALGESSLGRRLTWHIAQW